MSSSSIPTVGKYIRQLPQALSNKIAAGEVVQRPSSVVKELLDNAIDAGATSIEVYVVNAGRTLIQVVDNGAGICKEDIPFAFKRHATSKIQSVEDLFNIQSLGFRGEALASIASVAQVTVRSRPHEEEMGYEFEIWGGEEKELLPMATPAGTQFTVKNLFFNVPARRSFLKTDVTEFRHIISVFQQLVLANPSIGVKLYSDSNIIYDLPQQTLKERIVSLFGKSYRASLLKVSEETTYLNVSGFLIDPKLTKRTRGEQFLFINGRPFYDRHLHFVVQQIYRQWISPNEYPFYALFFEMNPSEVDVNVHPTKMEIKFGDEKSVVSLTRSIIKRALNERYQVPEITRSTFADPRQTESTDRESKVDLSFLSSSDDSSPGSKSTHTIQFPSRINQKEVYRPELGKSLYGNHSNHSEAGVSKKDSSSEFIPDQSKKPDYNRDRGFWQLHDQFIFSQTKTGVCVVDQHLAHKRILFESFQSSLESGLPSTQQLLFPQTIEFSATEFALLSELLPQMIKMGFNIQLLSGFTAIINGVPADLVIGDEKDVVESVLSQYSEMTNQKVLSGMDRLAYALAEKASIPRGRKMSQLEMEKLFDQLFACSEPFFDPMGKPTLQYIPLTEFKSKFR